MAENNIPVFCEDISLTKVSFRPVAALWLAPGRDQFAIALLCVIQGM